MVPSFNETNKQFNETFGRKKNGGNDYRQKKVL